jgi:cell division protein FtsZ
MHSTPTLNKDAIVFEIIEDHSQSPTIKVIGIGGAGGNAINHMIEQGVHGVTFVVIDTDKQALSQSHSTLRLKIDINMSDYLASSIKERIKVQDRESLHERIKAQLWNTDLVLIIAGMGGATGTELSTIVAKIALEMKILTLAVVTLPFTHDEDSALYAI